MAAIGVGLLVLFLGPRVEELLVLLLGPRVKELMATTVGDAIAKDSIPDRLASLNPPVGAVLVAPPSLLYVEGG